MAQIIRGDRVQEDAPDTVGARRLVALLSSMRDLMFVRDERGTLTYCSPSVFEALGYRPADLVGTPARDLLHAVDDDGNNNGGDGDAPSRRMAGAAPRPPFEVRIRDRSGEWHWFEAIESDLLDDPAVLGVVTTARDVTARKAENVLLLERSRRDPLTDLANRRSLLEQLEIALARATRRREAVAVFFCDLDDFKLVNDRYGHNYGDHVLIEVARRLENLQRKSDTVARLGGDEFVVVCDGLHDADESADIASRLHHAIAEPIVFDGRECMITASIGIVTVDGSSGEGRDPTAMLHNADAAMYRAKHQGRARWHRFDDALVREATRRFELEAEMAPALERGEFVLRYEPIHELVGRSIVGVEAFLGWEHPTRGFLQPEEFLEIAEQTGMIVPIGAWAMRAACAQARRWADAGWPGWMSVNVSGRELAEPTLAASVETILAETRVAPDRLWLELSENVFSRAGSPATAELRALQTVGVHIGVDNFGTAHTPLPRLQQMPTDFVKIDQTFVSDLTAGGDIHPAGCNMVAALVSVGTTLGLSVIAEGIRSEAETSLLVECGCQYGQGEMLARSAPAASRPVRRS